MDGKYYGVIIFALELCSHVSQFLVQCVLGCRISCKAIEQNRKKQAMCLSCMWETYPSSISRNLCADPESELMKAIVPIGIIVWSSLWAQIMGPIVFVWRWKANSSKDLLALEQYSFEACAEYIHLGCSLQKLAMAQLGGLKMLTLGYLSTPALITT